MKFTMQNKGWFFIQTVLLLLILFSPFRIIIYLPLSVRCLGLFFIILGSSLTVYAALSLKENLKPSPKPRTGGCLVTAGLYSIVRHSAYSCILLTALGISLWMNDAARLLLTLGLFVFFDFKLKAEEKWLEKTYSDYTNYKNKFLRNLFQEHVDFVLKLCPSYTETTLNGTKPN